MLLNSISPGVSSTVVSDALLAAQYRQEDSGYPLGRSDQKMSVQPDKSIIEMDASTPASLPPAQVPSSDRQSLLFEDLGPEQQAVFTDCVIFQGYPDAYVLKACLECGPRASRYDIEKWWF